MQHSTNPMVPFMEKIHLDHNTDYDVVIEKLLDNPKEEPLFIITNMLTAIRLSDYLDSTEQERPPSVGTPITKPRFDHFCAAIRAAAASVSMFIESATQLSDNPEKDNDRISKGTPPEDTSAENFKTEGYNWANKPASGIIKTSNFDYLNAHALSDPHLDLTPIFDFTGIGSKKK